MGIKDWENIDWKAGSNVREGEATCFCGNNLRGFFVFLHQGQEIVSEYGCAACGGRLMRSVNATGLLPSQNREPPDPGWAQK